jgi:hypothetical protein
MLTNDDAAAIGAWTCASTCGHVDARGVATAMNTYRTA